MQHPHQHGVKDLWRDERGATAVEFAVVGALFFTMMLAVVEFGLMMFTSIALESAVQEAARSESIGAVVKGCPDRVCTLQFLVKQSTANMIHAHSVLVTAAVVTNGTGAASIPDMCLQDPDNPYPDTCPPGQWVEHFGNPNKYDKPAALTSTSIGVAGDLVEVRASYLWRPQVPFFGAFYGDKGVITLSSATVVMNEPF